METFFRWSKIIFKVQDKFRTRRVGQSWRTNGNWKKIIRQKWTRGNIRWSICPFVCPTIFPCPFVQLSKLYNMSVCPFVHSFICPVVHLLVCLSICPFVFLSICPFIHLSLYPFVPISVCPYIHLSLYPFVHLSICPFKIDQHKPFLFCSSQIEWISAESYRSLLDGSDEPDLKLVSKLFGLWDEVYRKEVSMHQKARVFYRWIDFLSKFLK